MAAYRLVAQCTCALTLASVAVAGASPSAAPPRARARAPPRPMIDPHTPAAAGNTSASDGKVFEARVARNTCSEHPQVPPASYRENRDHGIKNVNADNRVLV